jgi:DNA (cytosine-5)-methyltransferase 1
MREGRTVRPTASIRRRSIEICAGAGGQAVGLEAAGFDHAALIEIDPGACATLRLNRPDWNVIELDLRKFKPSVELLQGIDLLAGGVPCPPFSLAGKQLGREDERDLFPAAIDLAAEIRPRAVMIENVRGLMQRKFDEYRRAIMDQLEQLGYVVVFWDVLNASDFGVPQLRPRSILVALQEEASVHFEVPATSPHTVPTVGEVLLESMSSGGWEGASAWATRANSIAPTLVGGSKKHGGADLGPTRAKAAWRELGVDGMGVGDAVPGPGFDGLPRLTVQQAALIQGFPRDWTFAGRKTSAYRQVGNAFPPPVAEAMGRAIRAALDAADEDAGELAV